MVLIKSSPANVGRAIREEYLHIYIIYIFNKKKGECKLVGISWGNLNFLLFTFTCDLYIFEVLIKHDIWQSKSFYND